MKFEAAPSIYMVLGVALSQQAGEPTHRQPRAPLEAAKAEFEASREAWKAWAKLEEAP
jgi:hypothetical protein